MMPAWKKKKNVKKWKFKKPRTLTVTSQRASLERVKRVCKNYLWNKVIDVGSITLGFLTVEEFTSMSGWLDGEYPTCN